MTIFSILLLSFKEEEYEHSLSILYALFYKSHTVSSGLDFF